MTDETGSIPEESQQPRNPVRGRMFMAWLLIGFGLLLLMNNLLDLSGGIFLIGIGAAFLIGYANARNYGLLIPGMILIGLGLGTVVEDLRPFGVDADWTTFWLGAAFLGIYLIDRFTFKQGGSWPLWPGGFLVLFGLWDIARELEILDVLWWDVVDEWWPLALIVVGFYLLRTRSRKSKSAPPGEPLGSG